MRISHHALAASGVALAHLLNVAEAASFVDDSSARLNLRNYYYNSDTRSSHVDSIDEWGQAMVLDIRSGYTEGTVGVGLDLIGTLAFKLDASGPGQLFPRKSNGEAVDNFSRAGATAKVRVSQTELKVGTLQPRLPILMANDGRLMPQLFEGGMVTSKELEGLTLNAGEVQRATGRMSSDKTGLSVPGSTRESHSMRFAGADYNPSGNLLLQAYVANVEDFYTQRFLGVTHTQPFSSDHSLKTDLRYFDTRSSGANARGEPGYATAGYTSNKDGEIDNRTWSAMFTYSAEGHAFSLGYQNVSDGSNFVQLNQGSLQNKGAGGTSLYLITDRLTASFNYAGERTWLGQYVYNFAAIGVPGLNANVAYLSGDNIKQASGGREWERDLIVSYTLQSGTFKGVSLMWLNSALRSDAGGDIDQNRLAINWPIQLW